MTDLSVNVDHVATLRQARKAAYPDPVEAAEIAEQQGATGITIHLRSDRRHIQESDLARLRQTVKGKLNLEMATTEEMTTIALRYRPDQVSLVPERPEEVTTEGGLDLLSTGERVVAVAKQLEAQGNCGLGLRRPGVRDRSSISCRRQWAGSRASRSTPTATRRPRVQQHKPSCERSFRSRPWAWRVVLGSTPAMA